MPVRMLPDAERLVADYLRGHADVAALVTTRVSTELPPQPVYPLVTLSRIGGVPAIPNYLDNPRIEIYCWATGRQAARTLAATVQAAMFQIVGVRPLGTVTGAVEDGLGPRWDPDTRTNVPRYTLLFELYIHP